ncbi:hypothetical protein F2Q70_00031200 [Brassica cretica]|uniref:Uncharacterized protein n=1 Tax=Brassica cretica TaxID=69181 RepID=A0A8S9GX28_BRACR|nr:hypothetical protein F2Q70_00031200 [Brassica cretica]KAF2550109.1 hypothetical protein F2Q68_00035553 [Brassica cretica]
MWTIKKQDLALKERVSKMKLLDSLIAKQGPLADYEEALKKKLINDLCCSACCVSFTGEVSCDLV